MDIYDVAGRSRNMSAIRSKHTKPELLLRRTLHKLGLRYRLHGSSLPGSPDLVFRRFDAVLFVHGCFWHVHGCFRSTVPKSHQTFWRKKFIANRERDLRNVRELQERGWRGMIVWECSLRGKFSGPISTVSNEVKAWLESSHPSGEIVGRSLSLHANRSDHLSGQFFEKT